MAVVVSRRLTSMRGVEHLVTGADRAQLKYVQSASLYEYRLGRYEWVVSYAVFIFSYACSQWSYSS